MQHIDFTAHQFERVTPGDYRARVRSIIGTDGWTAERDLRLIENSFRGIPIGATAAALVVTPQQAVARRRAIVAAITYRDDVPLEHRALVLGEMRAAVAREAV